MDLRAYYRKRREIERGLPDGFVVVKSLATPDGGVPGRLAEVTREVAARMIADGMAEAALAEEALQYRQQVSEDKKREDERRSAAQVQLTVVTAADLLALQRPARRRSKE